MNALSVSLFGKFRAWRGQQVLANLDAQKVQELLCYLLLHRERPHPREVLADLLWSDWPTAQSLKYLRKALWQLQAALDTQAECSQDHVLLVETDWIQVNPEANLWLDVTKFQQAFALVQGVPGQALNVDRVQALQEAVNLYQGDLLEGWYQDWCLYERERLQHLYLAMLDKLMSYYEAQHEYEIGLLYGTRILRYDPAHERTHRHLMRIYYLAGDRTAALRQYERCVAILNEELGVRPAKRTVTLYEQIRADEFDASALAPAKATMVTEAMTAPTSAIYQVLNHLEQLHTALTTVQHQVQQDIEAVKLALVRKS